MNRKLAAIAPSKIEDAFRHSGLNSIGNASIRDIVKLVNDIERVSQVKFVRMEMGVPGLKPPEIATNAEIEALKNGVASKYPLMEGEPFLKKELSLFVKNFLDVDVDPIGCVPTAGSMQGAMAAFLSAARRDSTKDTVLFIDPGFPVQKTQLDILGLRWISFDIHDYRSELLHDKLESMLKDGNISMIVYSNPNNPTWICLDDAELSTIASLADRYGIIVLEDLAYLAMDFRVDYSEAGKPPFQASIAKYTDNYIILLSGSKIFSFAGQRIAGCILSDKVYSSVYPDLRRYFNYDVLGRAFIWGALYVLSSGTSHSAQYAFAAILKASNSGEYNFVSQLRVYGDRAKKMKAIFSANGFHLVYDHDKEKELADGFYFSIGYGGFTGDELVEELLYYGIGSISLITTGSSKDGIRACVSQIGDEQMVLLEKRLADFHADHPI